MADVSLCRRCQGAMAPLGDDPTTGRACFACLQCGAEASTAPVPLSPSAPVAVPAPDPPASDRPARVPAFDYPRFVAVRARVLRSRDERRIRQWAALWQIDLPPEPEAFWHGVEVALAGTEGGADG